MDVVIVGYGRMGREIETQLLNKGHKILRRVDNTGTGDTEVLDESALAGASGVIEFALAEGIQKRIQLYAASALPVVVGTTGWGHLEPECRRLYGKNKSALLRGDNFSIGAHMFFRLTAAAARLANTTSDYDVALTEYHHAKKADFPSGTALRAARGVLKELNRKNKILTTLPDGPIPPDALQVASVRAGSIPGVHEMCMDSPADFITVRHEARNRSGFALGAVLALQWLSGRSGWYDVDEFIDSLLT